MSDVRSTGTRDITYDLISVAYHALQGAETSLAYIEDADQAGDDELAAFFRQVQEQYRQNAEQAKALLGQRMGQGRAG